MSAGAVLILRQNRHIRAFQQVRAESPETARMLDELHVRDSWIFRRMVARGVFVRMDGDRWYLSRRAAEAFLRRRRTIMFWLAAAGLVLLALVMILSV